MKKVLLISYYPPCKTHAGGQRLLDIYTEMKNIQPDTYLALAAPENKSFNMYLLRKIFDEVHFFPRKGFSKNNLSSRTFNISDFDVIDLQFYQAGTLIAACRTQWPSAKLIFSPMESQLRALKIALTRNIRALWQMKRDIITQTHKAMMEIYYVMKADMVVTVSESDREALAFLTRADKLTCLPTCIPPQVSSIGDALQVSAESATIVFFAYFEARTNKEAINWFVREVHPVISRALPNYRLRVVGHGINEDIANICAIEQVELVGSVPTIVEALRGAAVGIAPALSGAGIRGKIHQYAALGLPCVATSIACDGLTYVNRESIYIANEPHEFAQACITLLRDKSLSERVGQNAMTLCWDYYQWPRWQPEIASIYELNN